MLTKVYSATLHGIDAVEVEIEVNEGAGKPLVILVGLPDTAVKESRERVITAVMNSGYQRNEGTLTINLAPADLRKEGPRFDLPIAVGVVLLNEEVAREKREDFCIIGELALDGSVRPVKGALAVAIEARKRGKKSLLLPVKNAQEAAVIEGLNVYGVRNLREAVEFLQGLRDIAPVQIDREKLFQKARQYPFDFLDVKGQQNVKRALEVSAAGGHNLLMIGPPGTGKSMLAKRLPTILPLLSEEEAIETTKIHSIAGSLENNFLATRPFRSPHHTISDAGLLGGGTNPGPGEISLAHHGVLFLDELPEFRRSTLEVMRQPLEDRKVTISRAAGTMTFPASFMLITAMNPCPCGYYTDPKRECRCSPRQIENYRQRISGPLLDRIDLHVEVSSLDYRELSAPATGEGSSVMRERVEEARKIQEKRFAEHPSISTNSAMSSKLLQNHVTLDAEGTEMLHQAMEEFHLSARAHDRILKVASTIADLEGSEKIKPDYLLEAIQFRTLDRNLWV